MKVGSRSRLPIFLLDRLIFPHYICTRILKAKNWFDSLIFIRRPQWSLFLYGLIYPHYICILI